MFLKITWCPHFFGLAELQKHTLPAMEWCERVVFLFPSQKSSYSWFNLMFVFFSTLVFANEKDLWPPAHTGLQPSVKYLGWEPAASKPEAMALWIPPFGLGASCCPKWRSSHIFQSCYRSRVRWDMRSDRCSEDSNVCIVPACCGEDGADLPLDLRWVLGDRKNKQLVLSLAW